MIKGIIFDAGDVTLFNRPVLQDILKEFDLRREDVIKEYRSLIKRLNTGKITEKEFWRLFKRKFNITKPTPRPSPFVKHWGPHAVEKSDVIKIVSQLKRDGYKIGLLSSTIPPHARHMRKIHFLDNFDVTVLSCEVGMNKPSQKIYRLTAGRLGISPKEAVFIDNREDFVEAAKKIGMKGIVFYNAKQLKAELRKAMSI